MQIRFMKEGDLPAVAALEQVCFSMPWSEKALQESFESGHAIFLVAEEQDRVVGYMGLYTMMEEADVTNVAVDPACRRKGIGRALLYHMMDIARKRGVRVIHLEVRVSNEAAKALYEQVGFQYIGQRRNFYDKPKEDACLMQAEIKPNPVCSKCGREIAAEGACPEDYLQVEKQWGYFSKDKDGLRHRFCLCEACYDQMTKGFVHPVQEEEALEW